MHPATERFPPGRDGVEILFEELAAVPEDPFLFLARSFPPKEQARRDAAWERVLEEAAFRHRDGTIDEIRTAAIDHVAVRHSADDLRHAAAPFGLAVGAAVHEPEAQARVVNAIIEAAGAILVADLPPLDDMPRARDNRVCRRSRDGPPLR